MTGIISARMRSVHHVVDHSDHLERLGTGAGSAGRNCCPTGLPSLRKRLANVRLTTRDLRPGRAVRGADVAARHQSDAVRREPVRRHGVDPRHALATARAANPGGTATSMFQPDVPTGDVKDAAAARDAGNTGRRFLLSCSKNSVR